MPGGNSKRLNNLEVKINKHEKLSCNEVFGMFLSMFASKNTSCEITEKATHIFHNEKYLTSIFRGGIVYAYQS